MKSFPTVRADKSRNADHHFGAPFVGRSGLATREHAPVPLGCRVLSVMRGLRRGMRNGLAVGPHPSFLD